MGEQPADTFEKSRALVAEMDERIAERMAMSEPKRVDFAPKWMHDRQHGDEAIEDFAGNCVVPPEESEMSGPTADDMKRDLLAELARIDEHEPTWRTSILWESRTCYAFPEYQTWCNHLPEFARSAIRRAMAAEALLRRLVKAEADSLDHFGAKFAGTAVNIANEARELLEGK